MNFIWQTWDRALQTQSGSKMGPRWPPYELTMNTLNAFDRGFGTFDRDFGTKKWPNCFPGGFPHPDQEPTADQLPAVIQTLDVAPLRSTSLCSCPTGVG